MNALPLLLLAREDNVELSVDLPLLDHNIFNRIIRDPGVRWANERRCSEMLCAVLMNAPELRVILFNWFAKLAGQKIRGLSDMFWSMKTEEDLDGKRIDLSIRGRKSEDGDNSILWLFEIKVGADFHMSSTIADSDEGEMEEDESLDVNQLLNYDHWLSKENVKHKAGFVLSVPNSTNKMPEGLIEKWPCFTWTGLGLQVEEILSEDDKLPPADRMLARHLLGFIRNYLWRDIEMNENKLTFEEIAMIKAVVDKAYNLETKTVKIVEQLKDVIEAVGIGSGSIAIKRNLYLNLNGVIACRTLLPEGMITKEYIRLNAGIIKGHAAIRIDCIKNYNKAVAAAVSSVIDELQKLDERWVNEYAENEEWQSLHISLPLEDLLQYEDQAEFLCAFTKKGLEQLKAVQLETAIEKEINKE